MISKHSKSFGDFALIALVVYASVVALSVLGVFFYDELVRKSYTAALPDWYLPYGIGSTLINAGALIAVFLKRRLGAYVLCAIAWLDFAVTLYMNQFAVRSGLVDSLLYLGLNLLLTFALISERKKFK